MLLGVTTTSRDCGFMTAIVSVGLMCMPWAELFGVIARNNVVIIRAVITIAGSRVPFVMFLTVLLTIFPSYWLFPI